MVFLLIFNGISGLYISSFMCVVCDLVRYKNFLKEGYNLSTKIQTEEIELKTFNFNHERSIAKMDFS